MVGIHTAKENEKTEIKNKPYECIKKTTPLDANGAPGCIKTAYGSRPASVVLLAHLYIYVYTYIHTYIYTYIFLIAHLSLFSFRGRVFVGVYRCKWMPVQREWRCMHHHHYRIFRPQVHDSPILPLGPVILVHGAELYWCDGFVC